MNTIATFRVCDLEDDDLLYKIDNKTDKMYEDYKVPTRHIPALPNDDYDILIGELILRFRELKAELGKK